MFDFCETAKRIVLVLAVLLACGVRADDDAQTRYAVTVLRVVDGDTFVADIHLGFGLKLTKRTVRIAEYDAWETSNRRRTIRYADDELERGAAAKEALERLFAKAKSITVIEHKSRDPYGRSTLWVYVDGREVGDILRSQGHERKDAA